MEWNAEALARLRTRGADDPGGTTCGPGRAAGGGAVEGAPQRAAAAKAAHDGAQAPFEIPMPMVFNPSLGGRA